MSESYKWRVIICLKIIIDKTTIWKLLYIKATGIKILIVVGKEKSMRKEADLALILSEIEHIKTVIFLLYYKITIEFWWFLPIASIDPNKT